MTIASTAHTTGYRIAASCPGCGAAVEFGSGLFVTVCAHCHSPLRLILPQEPPAFFIQQKLSPMEQKFAIDRFCKENGEPLPSSMYSRQFFFPYWHVDGVMLKVRNEVERREVVSEFGNEESSELVETERRNITLAPFAVTTPAREIISGIPASIGLRAQYLTLLPLAEDKLPRDAEILPAAFEQTDALKRAEQVSKALSTLSVSELGKNSNRFFPLRYSLIWYPYAVYESYHDNSARRFTVDLLDGTVCKAELREPANTTANDETNTSFFADHQVNLAFHRCPNCGNDLPQQQSFLYLCASCGQKIAIPSELPPDTPVQYLEADTAGNIWFPFWVLSGRVVPGFRSGNYEAMFRLARRVSGACSKFSPRSLETSSLPLAPVQVSLTEARAIAAADEARRVEEKRLGTVANSANFDQNKPTLLFIPFHREQYFYVDSCLKAITFEQAAVSKTGLEPVG